MHNASTADSLLQNTGADNLNVVWSKEKLSIEIRSFDTVHVGDSDVAVTCRCNSHHRPVLEHLTSDSAGTDLHISPQLLYTIDVKKRSVKTFK